MLLAYKPDSSDYCRGCHMGDYPSDLEFETRLTEDELLEKWSRLKSRHAFLGPGEANFDFTLIKDGRVIHDEIEGCPDGPYAYMEDFDDDEYKANETYEADQTWLEGFRLKLEAATQEKITAEKQKRQEKEQKEREEKEQKAKQQRQNRYEALKKEFENG
jgi:hypothetical protein